MAMPPFEVPVAVDAAIRAEAERTHPDECCGVLLWRPGDPASIEVLCLANQQARLHAADPVAWPRDARTAYQFDALALERTLARAASDGRTLAAIFHSHPEHGAYFSETDRAAATPFGTPTYPDAAQLVYSVMAGRAAEAAAFRWDAGAGEYVGVALRVVGNR